MTQHEIILENPNSEITKEGFKKGDKVLAEIDNNGRAWFKTKLPLFNNDCVMYPGDYSLVPNADYDSGKLASITNQSRFELWRQLDYVPAFSLGGRIFLGNASDAVADFIKANPEPADFYVWLQDNYKEVSIVNRSR